MSYSKKPARAGTRRVGATEAAKAFGRLVDRVREERATYVIERGGKAVAQIGPVERRAFTMADFKDFIRTAPHADEAYATAVERVVGRHSRLRVRRNPWAR